MWNLTSFSKSRKKIILWKKLSSLYDTFEIFAIFEILPIFEISNANFGQMAIIIVNFFFMIFDENDFLYILVEFETDRMSPRESAKNGRIGAHGYGPCMVPKYMQVLLSSYFMRSSIICSEKFSCIFFRFLRISS